MPMPFETTQSKGKRIANQVVQGDYVDSKQLELWIEGASQRLIQQEQEIKSLKFNFYIFLFLFIGLPILLRGFG